MRSPWLCKSVFFLISLITSTFVFYTWYARNFITNVINLPNNAFCLPISVPWLLGYCPHAAKGTNINIVNWWRHGCSKALQPVQNPLPYTPHVTSQAGSNLSFAENEPKTRFCFGYFKFLIKQKHFKQLLIFILGNLN